MVLPQWPINTVINTAPTVTAGTSFGASATARGIVAGYVVWDDGGTHDLRQISFRTGASSLSGTLRVSVRAVDTANGPPMRDDGTIIQSATQVNPAGSTNYDLTLGADITNVATGTEYCIVWDYSAYTSGNCGWGVWNNSGSGSLTRPAATIYNGTTYAVSPEIVMVTLVAADGTVGYIEGLPPRFSAAVTATAFNTGSADDELAMSFTTARPLWCGGFGVFVNPAAGADFQVILYEDTTALVTKTIDANTWGADATPRWVQCSCPDQALVSGKTYRVTVKPTTANSVTAYVVSVSAAGHLAAWADTCAYSARADGGAWANDATKILYAYLNISAVDDAAGGTAGSIYRGGGPRVVRV